MNTIKSTTAVAKSTQAKAKAPAIKKSTLTGLRSALKAYNGLTCTEVQQLPIIGSSSLILVQVDDAAKHKLQPLIAVYEVNLASPERAKKAKAETEKLEKVRDEITAYLASVGFKAKGKGGQEWVTDGRNSCIAMYLHSPEPGEDEICIDCEVRSTMRMLEVDCLGDTFDVKTLKEFKSCMRSLFDPLAKDMIDKDFLNVVEIASKLAAK